MDACTEFPGTEAKWRVHLSGFPLTKEPDFIDEQGRAVFELKDEEHFDRMWEKVMQFLFPGVKVDNTKVDQILRERKNNLVHSAAVPGKRFPERNR